MKLHQLFETSLADNFSMEHFVDDVAPFLDELMKSSELLYHGSARFENGDPFSIEQFALRDKPKDTPQPVYDAINDWTRKHFRIEPRRWMFTTSYKHDAYSYGEIRAIFPIGSYDYFYIAAIKDFFRSWRARVESKARGAHPSTETQIEVGISMLNEYLEGGLVNYNQNLKKATDWQYEVMMKCNSYYAIDYNFLKSEVMIWHPSEEKYKKYRAWFAKVLEIRT